MNSVLIIILVVIGIIAFSNFNLITQKLSHYIEFEYPELVAGVLIFLCESILGGLFKLIGKALQKKISTSSFIKHKLYYKLRPFFLKLKHTVSRMVGNKSLNSFYHTKYKPTKEQKEVSEYIASVLNKEENTKKILWIQGETFSGKTTTISHLLIDLISKEENYKMFMPFNNKIAYVDLFKDNFSLFKKRYEGHKFEKSILIIDNTYILSEGDLLELVNILYNNAFAKLIVVCLRNFNEISNDPYYISILKDKMNLIGKIIHIPQIKGTPSSFTKGLLVGKYKLKTESQMDSSTLFHYMSMCEKDKENGCKIFDDIISYLNRNIVQDNINHRIIFMISTYCIFTGSFTKKQLEKQFSGLKNNMLLELVLSELHSCGFIDRSPYGFGEIYILNAEVAKHYFKIGYKSKHLKEIAPAIIEQQYEYNFKSKKQLAFLYGCLLKNKTNTLSELFDSIAINTNFRLLLNEMNFLETVEKDIESTYRREIGILCDRTGEFLKSRKKFRDLLNDCEKRNDIDLALETFYRLVQIDHTEYINHNKLKEYHSNLPYLKLQKKYWKLHIDMHKGKFSFEGFLDLLDETNVLTEKTCYDHLHLARRIYFDVYRLYYLEGTNNTKELMKIKEKGAEVEKYLQENLDEYNLYYTKFTTQFLLSFDLIYNLALYGDTVGEDVYKEYIKCIDIEYSSMSDQIELLNRTIKLCEDLESGFDNIGDKTFNFIRYYRTSLLIIKNDPSVKSLIKQYRDFGTHEIEYRLYAEFMELKYRISQLLDLGNISSDDNMEYKTLKEDIKEQFEIVYRFFREGYSNDYAVMRYKVYELLLSIIYQKSVPKDLLNKSLALAYKNNYYREIKLLEEIQKRESNETLFFGWIRNALLYYPIVPQ